ncbi:MAG: CaiB/BaiF CoA-transferase family protein [Chloroflexota bacterium]
MDTTPLTGMRILDLSRLLPGPYLTQLLAHLGAEIIKVETPRLGDPTRLAPTEMGLGNLFAMVNRGKKSLAVNYRNPQGREILLKLVAEADVVIEGFRPGVVARWGFDYEAVRKVKADIIYCSLSGYGQEGPYRNQAGHDLNYLAIGGAVALNARPGERPVPYGLPVADLSGAMLAGMAILSALVGRDRTGQGMYLDMALLDGVISWMTPLAAAAHFSGIEVSAGSLPLLGGLACFDIYETADGRYLTLAAIEPPFWGAFCKVTGRADMLSRQFDRALGTEIAAIFRQRSREDWLAAFAGTDGCVEPVNSFAEVLAHPQVRQRGYVGEENGDPIGINSPFIFARRPLSPAPALGEHSAEILQSVGFDKKAIDALAEQGLVLLG